MSRKPWLRITGCQLVFALLLTGLLAVVTPAADSGMTGHQVRLDEVLIVGVPAHMQPAWHDFFKIEELAYRFDPQTRTFYVRGDAPAVLDLAAGYRVLKDCAWRARAERLLEKELRFLWPDVDSPRVFVAYPDPMFGDPEESAPAAIVFAQGLSASRIDEVRSLVHDRVPRVAPENVMILGVDWRPGPPYWPETVMGNRLVSR